MCIITVSKLDCESGECEFESHHTPKSLFFDILEKQKLKTKILPCNKPKGKAGKFWKSKPIGGGHSLENCSEIMTRVGSTPTSSANE